MIVAFLRSVRDRITQRGAVADSAATERNEATAIKGAAFQPGYIRPSAWVRQHSAKVEMRRAAAMSVNERVSLLVDLAGGLTAAARLAKVTSDTVNNWRKPGARLPLHGVLPLCVAAGVSLDWLATGHMVRPDLQNSSERS